MIPVTSEPESLSTTSSTAADESGPAAGVLDNDRRRTVLRYLAEQDDGEAVSLSDLADHVAFEERTEDRGKLAEYGDALLGAHRRIHISLRHDHVPRLAAADAVTFNTDANTVTVTGEGMALLAEQNAAA
ncbi:DUF7344 domain-containing protein [Natronobacterium texcoconense]|uniref:DUF7344 domain-containing protein n=1 Tax=Natronobacterium texcoconense TaxID=1095778 RepID=A0A1H1EBB7_NATTX|nr:transcriptional regulator [Natronobacterium texcoconense]SDQ86062.1 hypothetical protein SAMN04489842_1524 [Natronobacterium texcoconense]